MLVETNSLDEASAGLVHSLVKGRMGTDACEAAIASAGSAAASNRSIDLPEMLVKNLGYHLYKIKSLRHAGLVVAYPETLPLRDFSRRQ